MKKESALKTTPGWKSLLEEKQVLSDDLCPLVSIVIPAFNSAQKIGITIESVLRQRYPDFEILVVDGGSTDRTLEIVKGFKNEKVRLCSISGSQRYEMINKGITIARGAYLNILFPGDFYIHLNTLMTIFQLWHQEENPDLIYCGCLLREAHQEPKTLYRPLTLKLLRNGQQPTSLQSCWFKVTLFSQWGKFDTSLKMRGGFDFLCRLMKQGHLSFCSTNRVLTDYDLRSVTRKMVYNHFYETGKIIYTHFGLVYLLKWFFRQKDIERYFRLAWKGLKVTILGRN